MPTKTRTHNDIPWPKVKKLWDAGKSYEFIAKAINRFGGPKHPDPTKATRAIVSRGLNVGFTDSDGTVIKLQPRAGMRAIGVGTKAPKTAKTKAPKVVKKTAKVSGGKPGRKPTFGKTILIQLDDSQKFLRIEAEKPKSLIAFDKVMPSLIDVLSKKGYDVVEKTVAEASVPASAVATPEATAPAAEEAPLPTVENAGTENAAA